MGGTPFPGGGYPPARTWEGGTPHPDLERGTPPAPTQKPPPTPPTNGGPSENITFRHPSDAGGINENDFKYIRILTSHNF